MKEAKQKRQFFRVIIQGLDETKDRFNPFALPVLKKGGSSGLFSSLNSSKKNKQTTGHDFSEPGPAFGDEI